MVGNAPPGELERIPLPKEIRRRPHRNRDRLARPIAANRNGVVQVHVVAALRPQQPCVKQGRCFRILACIGTVDGVIDRVEKRVLMPRRMIANSVVALLVNRLHGTAFEAYEIVVQVEFEIGIVAGDVDSERSEHPGRQQDAVYVVHRRESARIHVPPDLQKA